MSGLPFNVELPRRRPGPRHRPQPARTSSATPTSAAGDGITAPYFNVTPIGSPGSAFGRPARGTFGDMRAQRAARARLLERGRVALQAVPLTEQSNLELRVEAQNVFNHVNLGNPDAEIGVPGNHNPNAGLITGTAPNWHPRNLQFALRFQF